MKALLGQQILMRIYLGEGDRRRGRPTYDAIIKLLRERKLAGATVFRGAASYGSSHVLHTDSIEVMALNLPVIIECVDSKENIDAVIPELDSMIDGGLITLERAEVILYRSHAAPPNE